MNLLPEPQENLIPKKKLKDRTCEIGDEIAKAFAMKHLVMIPILTGAIRFCSRLQARLENIALEIEPVEIRSYHGVKSKKAQLDLLGLSENKIRDQHVLICDDVLDSGQTLRELISHIEEWKPASLHIAVMLLKKGKAKNKYKIKPDYVGFEIPDQFVVGMGLDYKGFYRNLSYIGILSEKQRKKVDDFIRKSILV